MPTIVWPGRESADHAGAKSSAAEPSQAAKTSHGCQAPPSRRTDHASTSTPMAAAATPRIAARPVSAGKSAPGTTGANQKSGRVRRVHRSGEHAVRERRLTIESGDSSCRSPTKAAGSPAASATRSAPIRSGRRRSAAGHGTRVTIVKATTAAAGAEKQEPATSSSRSSANGSTAGRRDGRAHRRRRSTRPVRGCGSRRRTARRARP